MQGRIQRGGVGVLAPTDILNRYIFILSFSLNCLFAPMVEVFYLNPRGTGSIY